MDRPRALAALAGVSEDDEPRSAGPPKGKPAGLAPQARNRISHELSDTSPPTEEASSRHWRTVLGDALGLGCALAFPVTGVGLVVIGALLLLHEFGNVGVDLAPGRPGLEIVGSAVGFGSGGWLLLGIAWEFPAGVQIRRRGFRLEADPARLWRVLALVAGILGILGALLMVVARPVWPTLSLGGMLWLASGATAVFVVAPVAVLILWAVERLWPSPRTAKLALPLLLLAWVAGTGLLFGWIWR